MVDTFWGVSHFTWNILRNDSSSVLLWWVSWDFSDWQWIIHSYFWCQVSCTAAPFLFLKSLVEFYTRLTASPITPKRRKMSKKYWTWSLYAVCISFEVDVHRKKEVSLPIHSLDPESLTRYNSWNMTEKLLHKNMTFMLLLCTFFASVANFLDTMHKFQVTKKACHEKSTFSTQVELNFTTVTWAESFFISSQGCLLDSLGVYWHHVKSRKFTNACRGREKRRKYDEISEQSEIIIHLRSFRRPQKMSLICPPLVLQWAQHKASMLRTWTPGHYQVATLLKTPMVSRQLPVLHQILKAESQGLTVQTWHLLEKGLS